MWQASIHIVPMIVHGHSSMRCVTCGNYWKTWRDKLYASRLSRPLRCWNYCDMQHMTSIKLTYTSCFDLILIHISTFPNVCKWGPWEKWLWYMTSIKLTYISSVDLTRSYKILQDLIRINPTTMSLLLQTRQWLTLVCPCHKKLELLSLKILMSRANIIWNLETIQLYNNNNNKREKERN